MRRWSLLWHCYGGGVTSCSNGSDDDPIPEKENDIIIVENFSYTANGNLIEVCSADKLADISPTSIIISVANVDGTGIDDEWWCSYYAGNDDWISMKDDWNDSISGYKTTITDSDVIAYFTENGIKIGMLSGLKADITVSYIGTSKTPETDEGDTTPGGGNENGDAGNNGDNDTEAPPETDKTLVKDFAYTADGNLIEVCSADKLASISPKSITISVANVAGTGDWWCSYYDGNNWISMKDDWNDSISGYKTTITDSTEISYFKENGIKIGMLSDLTATVTVTWE